MNLIQAIILAIVEGITEYLPISSTGHMIIVSAIMGINEDAFAKLFTIVIQLGAILAVVVLYWRRFLNFSDLRSLIQFYLKLALAFLPAAIIGKLFYNQIQEALGNVMIVAIALLVGGIGLIIADIVFKKTETVPDQPLTFKMAFIIGLCQTVAFIPGVSRSAASIVGGLSQKLNRKQAAEFSFFLAVPTMFAATVKDIYDNQNLLTESNLALLLLGSVIAFVIAILAIKTFLSYLTKHGFTIFGWYRIIVGGIILILLATGRHLQMM